MDKLTMELRAVSKILAGVTGTRQASKTKRAANSKFYFNELAKAQSTFARVPFEYAWDDPKKRTEIRRLRREIEDMVTQVIEDMPVPVTYLVQGVGKVQTFDNVEDLERFLAGNGIRKIGYNSNPSNRKELQGKPVFDKLIGPMYDGPKKVRYETQETYDRLSV